jgi:cardiolipin synthase
MARDHGRAVLFVTGSAVLVAALGACDADVPHDAATAYGQPAADAREPPAAAGDVPVIVGRRGEVSAAAAQRTVDRVAARATSPATVRELIAELPALGDEPLYKDNGVELLIDGPSTYGAMLDAIGGARHHVHLETYIFSSDAVGEQFADALIERQRAGVPVRVLYDAVGSFDSAGAFFERLQAAGVDVQVYNALDPKDPASLASLPTRDHRKILVVDGRVAFTGGINVAATYSSSSGGAKKRGGAVDGWRDTHIEIRGPAVAGLQKLFLANWRGQGRALADEEEFFPRLAAAGDELVQILHASGGEGEYSAIYHAYLRAMDLATERVWITQAYFAPDERFVATLRNAARRGVDVRIVLPGVSDVGLLLYASRGHYGELLREGVKLYESQGTVLHAKTAVIDGVWSTVGSSNLDYRSFLHNDEVNAIVLGQGFAGLMERQFQADIQAAKPVRYEEWRRRPIRDRVLETLSRWADDWL